MPGARLIVTDHSGFELVYLLADSATPEPGLHVPSWLIDPTITTLCCHAVVTSALKVTGTVVVVCRGASAAGADGMAEAAPNAARAITLKIEESRMIANE